VKRPGARDGRALLGFRSLRVRMTLWGGVIVALCLTAYSIAFGVSYAAHVDVELNRAVHEDLELAVRSVQLGPDGVPSWPGGTYWREVREEDGGGHSVDVFSTDGKLLLSLATIGPLNLGPPDETSLKAGPRTVRLPGGPFRVLAERVRISGRPFVVQTAVSEISARREVRSLWRELALMSLGVMTLGALAGFLLVRSSLGPLARMAEHARRITAERLDERLSPADAGLELNQLRDAFNETLARLERSFEELRAFTARASHELRTPLTAVRSVGEVALRQPRQEAEYREVIGTMLEEADKLARLLNGLLALARADAREAKLCFERVDLTALAHDVADGLAVLAEEREQTLEVRDGGPVLVNGDRLALRQALQNLVDNAIRYAPHWTRVEVRVANGSRAAIVEVRDEGPGIAPDERARVFERFFRGGAGRSHPADGAGLGLSIVKATAEAHGGRVELESEEGVGSTFRLFIPS
jgi:heavy metal sensor kinase